MTNIDQSAQELRSAHINQKKNNHAKLINFTFRLPK